MAIFTISHSNNDFQGETEDKESSDEDVKLLQNRSTTATQSKG